LLAERLEESLAASTACSESILILTGITAAIGANPRKENGAAAAAAPYRSGPPGTGSRSRIPDSPAMGETSGGAMVGAPDSGNTAAWACGHEASTLPLLPSMRPITNVRYLK
jgi:hypothetical protein